MKRILGWLALVLVLALAAAGIWYFKFGPGAAGTEGAITGSSDTFRQVVDVTRGDLSASLTVVGELAAVRQADLRFELMSGSAELLVLDVAPGNTVTAGQVLAAIDPAPYRQAVDQAASDLQAAEERLADLQTPATELEKARADLAIARAEFQRQQALKALDDLNNPDLPRLRSDVANAQISLATARSSLAELKADTAIQDQITDLREAENEAAAEHARLASETYRDAYYADRLQVAYNKMMNARDARITAEVQAQVNLLKAQMQVRRAELALADAQAALADAQAGPAGSADTALRVAQAELAVQDAEVALAAAGEARAQLDEGADAVELAAAQAEVDKKRLALADAEAALAGTKLAAPFDGTVLAVHVNAGDTIGANSQIVTVADLRELEVLASVDETTVRQVSAGQAAAVTFDALPGQSVAGTVASVPLQGTLQGGVMVYEVPVSLEGAAGLPLLVGMTANVAISVGQVQDALLVPAMALQKVGGMYQVLVPSGGDPEGEPEAAPVEVGLSDGTYTQIVRGLNEGDQVVVEMSSSDSNAFGLRGMGGLMGPAIRVERRAVGP